MVKGIMVNCPKVLIVLYNVASVGSAFKSTEKQELENLEKKIWWCKRGLRLMII